jgi:adenine-specific DNA-methyltransferase
MNIYAYILPNDSTKTDLIKIGQAGNTDRRIKEQIGATRQRYEKVFDQSALAGKRNVTDHDVHRLLVERGFERVEGEWFRCQPDDVQSALDFLKQKYINEDKRKDLSDKFYLELRNWYFWATEEQYQGLIVEREPDPDHALRIIVRLLLIFFLKEKGLVPNELFDENWIVENLREDKEHSYYKAILCNLFFHSLNTPQHERSQLENRNWMRHYGEVKAQIHERIPFLNGGLFNEHPGDDFALGNKYFFSGIETIRIDALDGKFGVRGLVTILKDYRYTFDETEDTSFIDPEFIGKVFESLLAYIKAENKESRQKITSSYYTPREIVDYMAEKALDSYLENHPLPFRGRVRVGESDGLQSPDAPHPSPLPEREGTWLENLLLRCTILDPACGSGAFPCGVMNAIMKRIDPQKKLRPSDRYTKKLEILRNVIYGVDKQPMAVQITVLRLFLSLLQEMTPTDDARNNFGIVPLPNLDYKFVVADTIRGIDGYDFYFHEHLTEFNQLIELKKEYFRESNVTEKSRVKSRINDLEKELADQSESEPIRLLYQWNHSDTLPAPYFDSRWMFGVEKFDIVLGNPPYLGEDDHKFIFEQYKTTPLGERFYKGKMDIFYFFFHAGLDFLREKGILTLITSNYYLTADGAVKLRKDLSNRSEILELVNFNELKIFESALGQHNVITLLRRSDQPKDGITKQSLTKNKGKASAEILTRILSGKDETTIYTTMSRRDIFDGENCYIRFSAGNGIDSILDKIANNSRSLGFLFLTNQGVVPGALTFSKEHALKFPQIKAEKNAPIFIYPKGMLHEIGGIDPGEMVEYIKPFFKNSDIRRYVSATETNKELLYVDGRMELPPKVLTYLKKFKPILTQRRECQSGKIRWFELQWARTKSLFEKPKIVTPYRCSRASFAYNDIPFYAATDVYYITDRGNNTGKLKALLGILNSTLINVWLYHRGKKKGETLELFSTTLRQIPIVLPENLQPFVDLVTRRLRGEFVDDEIDALVYELYGLTKPEIAILQSLRKSWASLP